MIPATTARTAEALRLIDRGGPEGTTLAVFAARWPLRTDRGAPRRTLAGVGHFLGHLVADGLVFRTARGPLGRFTVTAAGRKLLDEYDVEVEKARAAG